MVEIRKMGDAVQMNPRAVNPGNKYYDVDADAFRAFWVNTQEYGLAWLIVQKDFPRVVVQIIEASNALEFETLIGTALGANRWAEWIEDCTDFFCMQSTRLDRVIFTQGTCNRQMAEIREVIRDAAGWWFLYRTAVKQEQTSPIAISSSEDFVHLVEK